MVGFLLTSLDLYLCVHAWKGIIPNESNASSNARQSGNGGAALHRNPHDERRQHDFIRVGRRRGGARGGLPVVFGR